MDLTPENMTVPGDGDHDWVPPAESSESKQTEVVAVTAGVVALGTLATLLRLYVRAIKLRRWGADDWGSVVSYVFVLATGILTALNTRFGIGLHVWTVPVTDRITCAKIAFSGIIVYHAAVMSLKATFLLQYRRVFPLPGFQRLCDALLAFTLLFGLSQILATSMRCVPLKHSWDPMARGKGCINILVYWHVNAGVNLATDLAILAMPVPMLRRLPLAKKQKLILMGVFGLGVFTAGITIVRIRSLHTATTSNDVTYDRALAVTWSITELCCATICVCVPTLRPLVGSARSRISAFDIRALKPSRGSRPGKGTATCYAASNVTGETQNSKGSKGNQGAGNSWSWSEKPSDKFTAMGPVRKLRSLKDSVMQQGSSSSYSYDHPEKDNRGEGRRDDRMNEEEAGLGLGLELQSVSPRPLQPARVNSERLVRGSLSMEVEENNSPSRVTSQVSAYREGETDDDDFDEFSLHGEDLPTILHPPPRSHALRGSVSTAAGGRSTASLGIEDSPILKGDDHPRRRDLMS